MNLRCGNEKTVKFNRTLQKDKNGKVYMAWEACQTPPGCRDRVNQTCRRNPVTLLLDGIKICFPVNANTEPHYVEEVEAQTFAGTYNIFIL